MKHAATRWRSGRLLAAPGPGLRSGGSWEEQGSRQVSTPPERRWHKMQHPWKKHADIS